MGEISGLSAWGHDERKNHKSCSQHLSLPFSTLCRLLLSSGPLQSGIRGCPRWQGGATATMSALGGAQSFLACLGLSGQQAQAQAVQRQGSAGGCLVRCFLLACPRPPTRCCCVLYPGFLHAAVGSPVLGSLPHAGIDHLHRGTLQGTLTIKDLSCSLQDLGLDQAPGTGHVVLLFMF